MLRLLVVAVTIGPLTLYYGTKVLWAAYRGRPGYQQLCERAPRSWARAILRCAGVDVVMENDEIIDADRPQILVANHASWFDVLALAAYLPGHAVFVAKKELRGVPFFGRAAAACGQIFIDRSDRNRALESLAVARRELEKSSPTVIMFPEGTRSASGDLQPFKKGAFVLAIQSGVDVVPAAIFGSREIMKKGSLLIHPGTVRVRFGTPISVAGLQIEDRNQLTERAWKSLADLKGTAR